MSDPDKKRPSPFDKGSHQPMHWGLWLFIALCIIGIAFWYVHTQWRFGEP
jgi:hypothetical protein